MINSIEQDYAEAQARGDTQAMAYLRAIMGGIQNDPVAMQSVGMNSTPVQSSGVPQTQDNPSILSGTLSSLYGVLTHPLENLKATFSALGGNFQPGMAINNQTQENAKSIDKVGSSLSGGLNFITDIPRVATTLVGGLMIAAGLFALAGGSHTQIIEMVRKSS